MMQQAQELQRKMQKAQEELDVLEITGTAGGAGYMVDITITGKGITKRCNISDALINSDEKEMLQDLIVAACNNAKSKMDEAVSNKMSGLGISSDLLGKLGG